MISGVSDINHSLMGGRARRHVIVAPQDEQWVVKVMVKKRLLRVGTL